MRKGPEGPLLFRLTVRHIGQRTVGWLCFAPRLHSGVGGPMCHGSHLPVAGGCLPVPASKLAWIRVGWFSFVESTLSIRNYALHQVLDVAGHCLGWPAFLGASGAAFALVPRVDVGAWHVHPRRPGCPRQHKPPAAIAARLPLRMPPARRLAVISRHVVHPVFVAVSLKPSHVCPPPLMPN